MADPLLLAYLCLCFLAAGAIKGAVGMGLPTASIALLTLVLDPRQAIATLLIPMLVTNAWQVWRMGQIRAASRRYLPFALAMGTGVWITVAYSATAPDRLLFATLALALLIFVATNANRWAPSIPDRADRPAQIGFGAIAGIMGGLTAVWAPPMAIYLGSRQVSKDEFVRACGLLIFLGSLPLIAGYLSNGLMTSKDLILSSAMLIPAMAGFALGESARARLSELSFKKLLLIVFTIMALNLLRKAFL